VTIGNLLDCEAPAGGCSDLGEREWIEADPTSGKVHIWISAPVDGVWYERMTAHRWVACGRDGE
jgi:hypothetical protein